jgi:hypothetical protein
LADENIHKVLVEELRSRGVDVAWLAEGRRGLSDEDVAKLAAAEYRGDEGLRRPRGASFSFGCGVRGGGTC